jgi:hypothetical protein
MFARTTIAAATTLIAALALTVAAPSLHADEPEFQIVGTVEHSTLSLTILPRPGFRLGADTPVLVRVDGIAIEVPRKLYRREDAVDPRAEAPRFEIVFRRPPPTLSAPNPRINAELTFYVCKAARCRPVITRYGTSL